MLKMKCSVCLESMPNLKALGYHMKCKHPDNVVENVLCSYPSCGRLFPLKSFPKHFKSHRNENLTDLTELMDKTNHSNNIKSNLVNSENGIVCETDKETPDVSMDVVECASPTESFDDKLKNC